MNTFEKVYLECIGALKTTKKIVKENAKTKSKKTLIKEQAEDGLYNLKICVQDTYPYDNDFDDDAVDRTPEECPFDKLFTRLGGKCTKGPTNVTRNGEFEYVYEFNGISKDQLFELMQTAYEDDGMPLIEQYANMSSNFADNAEEFINSVIESPDAMVEAVKKLAEDPSDTMYIEFGKDGIDDEHTNLDAPNDPDDI